jgi:hypothetical protein
MGTVVKKIAPKVIKRATPTTSAVKKSKQDLSSLSLPTEPKEPNHDLGDYLLLIYGREKIGKTKMLSSFPNAIFFSTEPGSKGLRIYEFNAEDGAVRNWDIFRKGVDLLEKNRGQFKTVIIDTVDRAYDMCLDWVCENKGIEYPGQDSDGKEDFGKSWRAVKMEFLDAIHRLSQAGYGIVFTSHAKETEIKTRTGEKYWRIFPTMSGQARAVVEAIVDLFFYAEYVRGADGTTQRILVCEGDETIWAGARETVAETFPRFLPLLKEGGYDVIKSAFLGEDVGLDPATFLPTKQTSNTGRTFIQKAKTKAAVAK